MDNIALARLDLGKQRPRLVRLDIKLEPHWNRHRNCTGDRIG